MFKTKTYEVTENWLDPVSFGSFGANRGYLTKARIYHTLYDIFEKYRGQVLNFELRMRDRSTSYTVKVTNDAIEVYYDKRLLYEQKFLAPSGFDEAADWIAWKLVDERR